MKRLDKKQIIEFLLNLDIYNDYYGGPVIDDVIRELEQYFSNLP